MSFSGPLVADMAPAHLLGRYMSLYGLTFTISLASARRLVPSPADLARRRLVGCALAAVLAGAVLLRLGGRIPDPLREANSHVLRRARGRVSPARESHGGLRRMSRPLALGSSVADRSVDREQACCVSGPDGRTALARPRMRSAAIGMEPETTCPNMPRRSARVKSKEENVMNVLAIGRYRELRFDAYVPAEKQRRDRAPRRRLYQRPLL